MREVLKSARSNFYETSLTTYTLSSLWKSSYSRRPWCKTIKLLSSWGTSRAVLPLIYISLSLSFRLLMMMNDDEIKQYQQRSAFLWMRKQNLMRFYRIHVNVAVVHCFCGIDCHSLSYSLTTSSVASVLKKKHTCSWVQPVWVVVNRC